jgi:ribosome maturation factor RimP
MAQQSERLAAVLEPVVRDLGLELYDVEVGGSNRARTLRVLIDREGGVDLEAITSATEALAPVLDENPDVAAALPGSYLLEVSSPGLERPLRTPAHFRRAIGATVSVKSRNADGAVERRRAVLTAADDDGIEIEIEQGGARERVAYDDIVASHTVFEWGPAPKPGKSAKAKQHAPKQTTTTVPAQG